MSTGRIAGRIAQLVEQRARNRKVASSNPVKAYQTFHPSEVDKLVPVVVWPSGTKARTIYVDGSQLCGFEPA